MLWIRNGVPPSHSYGPWLHCGRVEIELRVAAVADIDTVAALIDGAHRRLLEKGITQWPPSPSLAAEIAARVHSGDTYLAFAAVALLALAIASTLANRRKENRAAATE